VQSVCTILVVVRSGVPGFRRNRSQAQIRGKAESEKGDDVFFFDVLVDCDGSENGVQGPEAETSVVGNRDALMGGLVGLQYDVTAPFVHEPVTELFHQGGCQLAPA
jgi:hypothetical protein